jgi:hypothetical protein
MILIGDGRYLSVSNSTVASLSLTPPAVCSPVDVLKSRIMNAHGPGSPSALSVIKVSYVCLLPTLADTHTCLPGWLTKVRCSCSEAGFHLGFVYSQRE